MATNTKQKVWWILASNAIMMVAWARALMGVLVVIHDTVVAPSMSIMLPATVDIDSVRCDIMLSAGKVALHQALAVSFLEVFNAVAGVTRSNPLQVLLFAVIRASVELLVAPMLSLSASSPATSSVLCPSYIWPHLFTVLCWSLGDTLRFGCFLFDAALDTESLKRFQRWPKSVRYSVGPVLFPLGTFGEMLMVLTAAHRQSAAATRWGMYAAASLWPVGFYALFTQLLKQRRKFFATGNNKTKSQ